MSPSVPTLKDYTRESYTPPHDSLSVSLNMKLETMANNTKPCTELTKQRTQFWDESIPRVNVLGLHCSCTVHFSSHCTNGSALPGSCIQLDSFTCFRGVAPCCMQPLVWRDHCGLSRLRTGTPFKHAWGSGPGVRTKKVNG